MADNINNKINDNNKNANTNAPFPMRGPGGRPGGGPMGFALKIEKPKNSRGTIKRILIYLGGNKILLIFLLFTVFIMAISQLINPLLQGNAIDAMVINDKNPTVNFDKLVSALIIMAIINLIGVFLNFLQGWLGASLAQKTVKRMRDDLFIKLSALPIKYFDTHSHGDIMSRLSNDIDNVSNTLSTSVQSLFSSTLTVVGSLFVMIFLNIPMTVITILAVPVGVLLTKSIAKKTRAFFKQQQTSLGELNGHIEEMVTGQKTVLAFSREKISVEQFDRINANLREYSIKAQIFSGMIGPLMNVVGNLSFVLVAISGGWMAWSGIITVGTIQTFINLSKQFSRPINEIANQYNTIQSAIAGAERVFEIMDQIPESDEGTAEFSIDEVKGKVEFKDVYFGYEPNQAVLKDFTISVEPGKKIALVGPTGAGKTTVVNLITRFYDIDKGQILLDNVDIRDIPKSGLRSSIAIVLQDTVLFSGSIKDNIRFGRLDATDEEIETAAKTANADTFIRRLPEGYDTVLSESGNNLSQGQRQLISIARAVLANPKILILDEATSSIDTRTEMHIQKAMIALMKGRTSFIIAHRLSTIRDADSILVIDGGKIAEKGNHRELLALGGHYYKLYQTQFNRDQEEFA
ncbi:MAG: transporter permease/ATP-binding protein [Clostridia bacterium]|nr:transporter permease/ATP-binding protein [Clostridia bacterium]